MNPIKIPHLQVHISHACNFTCESCAHYSNHGHGSILSLTEVDEYVRKWTSKLLPDTFTILGGEPTLNKDLVKFVYLMKEWWPNTDLNMTTNGSYLDKFPDLPKALEDTNTRLHISLHSSDKEYKDFILPKIELVRQWQKDYKIRVRWDPVYKTEWSKTYLGFGDNMLPYEDDNPEESWNNCPMYQTCFELHEGNIYKCSLLAYLPMQAKKYNLSEKWDHYLKYKPLTPDATDEEIVEFFNRKSESYCGMCPAKGPHYFKKKNPLLPVNYWKENV